MNSINMLDNMDGITAQTSFFIITTAIIFLSFNSGFEKYDYMICLGAIGSLIGFLFYNFHPSRMFMGDSGSQFLGLLVAIIGIKYFWNIEDFKTGTTIPTKQIVTVLIVFTLPIVDTTSVVINRIARKSSPFVGGKDHTTHHLSYLGFITFTSVDISPDLKNAKIYYYVLNQNLPDADLEIALNKKQKAFKKFLSTQLHLRSTPKIHFFNDKRFSYQEKIKRLINELPELKSQNDFKP